MQIVHLNAFDAEGGAARAAYRLHGALRARGAGSTMLVRVKASGDPSVAVASPVANTVRALVEQQVQQRLWGATRGFFTSALLPERNARAVAALAPDVVNLHWLGGGLLRPESFARVGAPLVWTLHDSWAFTGGCHVPGDCERFSGSCGACPALGSARERDLSRWVWRRKRRAWGSLDLAIVTPSRWMAERVRRSSLLADRRVEVIPNGLDLEVFHPMARAEARALLRLDAARRVVLFIAAGGAADPNKGFRFLADALRALAAAGQASDLELVVCGAWTVPDPAACGVPVRCVGQMRDDVSLALLYSAADVVVVPSVQENLPNTALEAFACGTPVAAFRAGGTPEVVDDGVNGRIVEPFDPRALADAIRWIIADPARARALSSAARAKAEREYGADVQARRYLALYADVLRRDRAPRAGE